MPLDHSLVPVFELPPAPALVWALHDRQSLVRELPKLDGHVDDIVDLCVAHTLFARAHTAAVLAAPKLA